MLDTRFRSSTGVPFAVAEPPTFPQSIETPQKSPFPILAACAPLVISVVLWLVTGSIFLLLFAFMSPVVAVASVIDRARARKRQMRASTLRHQQESHDFSEAVSVWHSAERARRDSAAPDLMFLGDHWERCWSAESIAACPVRLGRSSLLSELSVPGIPTRLTPLERELAERARTLDDAAVCVPAASVIAFVGPPIVTRAVVRGIIVWMALMVRPVGFGVVLEGELAEEGWDWLGMVSGEDIKDAILITTAAASDAGAHASAQGPVLVLVSHRHELPANVDVIIELDSFGQGAIDIGDGQVRPIRCELCTEAHAERWARRIAERAKDAGLAAQRLPRSLGFASLSGMIEHTVSWRELEAPIGMGPRGVYALDLIGAGPHAVVTGTTGSGKSELLTTWLLSIASRFSAHEVNFLLIDFKGGSAFDPLRRLEHCAGIITDLDEDNAVRAIVSLRAEVKYRELRLRENGVGSIDKLDAGGAPLPRLVVVVDEFAALIGERPELLELFTDLAARGRSLGIHLILSTQRAGGVLRDSLLANCGLRVSLRVLAGADSHALLGVKDAAELDPALFGRAIVVQQGELSHIQVARSSHADIGAVPRRGISVRAPWCEPLPNTIPLSALRLHSSVPQQPNRAERTLLLGLVDDPEHQRQYVKAFSQQSFPSLLVSGGRHSGKSACLAMIAGQWSGPVVLVTDVDALADALVETPADSATAGRRRLVLIDDLDSLLASCPTEWVAELVRLLEGRLKRSAEYAVVVTATKPNGPVTSLLSSFSGRITLRQSSKNDHLIVENGGLGFDAHAPAGRGIIEGHHIQLPLVEEISAPARVRPEPPRDVGAVISPSRTRALDFLGLSDAQHSAPLGIPVIKTPSEWLTQPAALAEYAAQGVLYLACSLSEYRMLSRSSTLPPVIGHGSSAGWLVRPDAEVVRVYPRAAITSRTSADD